MVGAGEGFGGFLGKANFRGLFLFKFAGGGGGV